MRVRFAAFVVLLLVFASLSASGQWQWGRPRPPRGGACFYRDPNFGGEYFCMKAGDRWAALPPGFNDRISSIRVFGGTRVRIFNDSNFRGPTLLIEQDLYDLREIPITPDARKSWNDRISSIAVFRGRDFWGGPPPYQERPPY